MSIDDYTTPLKPTSPQPLIDQCLALAESGDYSELVSESFRDAIRTLRQHDEPYYTFQVKPRLKQLKAAPITLSDLERYTKPPKAPKQRYKPIEEGEDNAPRQGKTDLFIQMVQQWAEVFNDDSGRSYASFSAEILNPDTGEVSTHRETWALDSKQFRAKASKEFMKRFGTVAGEANVKEGCDILSAFADEVPRQAVYMRYAPIPDNEGVYVDLVNDRWEIVEITAQGWRVIACSECKVKFRQVQHAKPLPVPERGGSLDTLWSHVNIPDSNNQLLVLGWLLETMRINTPYPILEIIAMQGSAKSSTQGKLRLLTDPNAALIKTAPRSLADLSIGTVSNHVISIDNLSFLSPDYQDFLCTMVTGGSDGGRRLYSNDDEVVWEIKRPLLINGINALIHRPDLADRAICIELQKIHYENEETLKKAWESDYPKILGALYDLFSKTLQVLEVLPEIPKEQNIRLSDFGRLGVAMLKAMGLESDFLVLFTLNNDEIRSRGVESSPVALALVERIKAKGSFEGTLAELLNDLDGFAPKHYDKAAWVKSPKGLGDLLRRIAPSLKVYGLDVEELPRNKHGKPYRIRKINPVTDTIEL